MNVIVGAVVFLAFLNPFHCLDNAILADSVSRNLELRLHMLVNSTLTVSDLEHIYETKTYIVTEQYKPREILDSLVSNITERLDGAVNILKRNRDYMESDYMNHSAAHARKSSNPCCVAKNLYFDARFDLIQDFKTCSSKFSMGQEDFQDMDNFYQENLDDSLIILWQYFGDMYGSYHQYPWKPRFCSKDTDIDHRFLDWYVYTASPQKKNIVLVLDESGSMSIPIGGINSQSTTQRVDVAKAAARTVLDTLSPTDHVGIVAFSDEPRSLTGCLGNHVVMATPYNKKVIHEFIDTVQPKSDTFYGKAFRSAFRLLHEAKQETPTQFENSLDMILFLTDGSPSDNNFNSILEEIATGQNNMNHSVQIFLYGLGQDILNSKQRNRSTGNLLLKIADLNNQKMPSMFGIPGGSQLKWQNVSGLNDSSRPVGPLGNLTILPDADSKQLNTVMGSYYTKFPMSTQTDYSVGHPHVEDGLGLVITLGIPTLDRSGLFFGVTAVDVAVELMFYEVIHFRRGRHSYGFVVDHDGKVIVHPYMMEPRLQTLQPKLYAIHQIEPALSAAAIYNITNGIPGQYGSKQATSNFWKRTKSSSQVAKTATYYYQPVENFHRNYTVVMVIFDEDIEELKADEDVENGEFPSFIYHRMDFYENSTLLTSDLCSRDDGFVLQNNATVKFAPSVYENPVKSVEYEQNINKSYPIYQHFRNAKLFSQGADIHQSASNDIVLTNITDLLWKMDDVLWRYLGTSSGFFKIFPGTMLTDIHYDPRNDLWYKKASRHPDNYVFIAMETKQNTSYITMAKVFHKTSNGTVSGVVAADMTRTQFTTILNNLLSECPHCYIIDDTGYVLSQSLSVPNVEKKHLTEVAGHVAFLLKEKGFLKSTICMNSTTSEKKLTFTLDLGDQESDIRQAGCHDYVLTRINRTNLFLLVFQPDNCISMVGTCICQENCLLCDHQMETLCQCPCSCLNRTIDDCSSNFTLSQGFKPCQYDDRQWSSVKTLNLHLSNVSQCQPQCPSLQNETLCQSEPGCTWCTHGLYKHIPICTENCPVDSVEITFTSQCYNLSDVPTLFSLVRIAVSNMIQDSNLDIETLQLLAEDEIRFNISTMDGSMVPEKWVNLLSKPLHINESDIVLSSGVHDFTVKTVTLTFSNVNFTEELETELTLRDYLETQIHDLVSLLLGDVPVTDIWPEHSDISFMVTLQNLTTMEGVLDDVQTWKSLSPIDVFGRQLTLINVSLGNVSSPFCKHQCDKLTDVDRCNSYPGCHWDVYSGGICTNDSLLPERVEGTIYLPCLGLYSNITKSDDEVGRMLIETLQMYVPDILHVLHGIRLKKDASHIGMIAELVLQGRITSPSVAVTWYDIQQIIQQHDTIVNIDGMQYKMNLQPITYQQFTNLHITLLLDGLDFGELFGQHPLTAREEVKYHVRDMVTVYLRPQVVTSINSYKLDKNTIEFSVDNSQDKGVNLRSEYDILQTAITDGVVNITLFQQVYTVNNVFFIGSFDQICSRNCSQGSQSTCDSIPGCDWSVSSGCVTEVVYPERKNISVVFPCVNFSVYNVSEVHYIKSETEAMISRYWTTKCPSTVVAGSSIYNENTVTVTLQSTSKSVSLAKLYKETNQWLTSSNIQIHVNGSVITGTSGQDYTSVSVALEFRLINFTSESMEQRKDLLTEITGRTTLVLSDGVIIARVWSTMSFVLFDILKTTQDLNIDLINEVKKIETFIDLGGLRVKMENRTIEPVSVYTNGSIDCRQYDPSATERKCFWEGQWSTHYCHSVGYPDRYTYEAYLPCNQTQLLTPDQVNETITVLWNKTSQIVTDPSVVLSIDISQSLAIIILQSTPLHPYIEQNSELLWQQIDYRTGFSFGPTTSALKLTPRHRDDFTNVYIELSFRSIDFDAIVNSGLASKQEVVSLLLKQLNLFMPGELVQTVQIKVIKKDYIEFSLMKSPNSLLDMSKEISKLQSHVNSGQLTLDLNYIRPVTATQLVIQGSFNEVCKSLLGHQTGSNVQPTFAFNISSPKVPVAMIPVPTILVVYNKSTASAQHLLPIIDTQYVDVCFVEAQQCHSCVQDYSWSTCSQKPHITITNEPPNLFDEIGPVQWTIIGVSAAFILALAVMAVQGIYEATKDKEAKGENYSYEENE